MMNLLKIINQSITTLINTFKVYLYQKILHINYGKFFGYGLLISILLIYITNKYSNQYPCISLFNSIYFIIFFFILSMHVHIRAVEYDNKQGLGIKEVIIIFMLIGLFVQELNKYLNTPSLTSNTPPKNHPQPHTPHEKADKQTP
jgi:hypothetical protein